MAVRVGIHREGNFWHFESRALLAAARTAFNPRHCIILLEGIDAASPTQPRDTEMKDSCQIVTGSPPQKGLYSLEQSQQHLAIVRERSVRLEIVLRIADHGLKL
jgi:hypothetical protein